MANKVPAQTEQQLSSAAAAGQWQQAETIARAALHANPRDVAAWTYLGLSQDHEGQKQQALHAFSEAARLAPQSTFAHNNYGASLEANGHSLQAAQQYRRSLDLDPQQPAALVNLARLRLAQSSPDAHDEARQLLRSAWQLAPDREIAQSLLLLQPCAEKAAVPATATAEVKAYGDAVVASAPPLDRAHELAVGHALLGCGLSGDAEVFAGALLASNSQDSGAVLLKAQAERAQGHHTEAGRTLETAIAGGLNDAAVYRELAEVYQQTDHMSNAVTAMRRALALKPGDAALQAQYGMLLLDAHAPKAAEIRMREAVERQPGSAGLWFVLGLAQFDQTRPADAQVSFDRALALDGALAPALAYRGLVALDQQRYGEAEAWYRKAIAADPSAADLHVLLAEALERQHPAEPTGMLEELHRALATSPRLASAYLMMGRLYLENGRPEDARQALETTLQLDPRLLQAHFYLARAYRQLHQPQLAASEGKIFGEQQASAEAADRSAVQEAARQLAHTAF